MIRLVPLALLLAACSGDSAPPPAPRETPPTVRVATLALTPIAGGFAASGVLVAREEAAVGSELAGYRVLRVLAEEGDRVRAGQPLAVLDGALLAGERAKAEAEVASARVAAERARADAARVDGLEGAGVIADETIAQRGFDARAADAQLGVARAGLAELRAREARLTLRAPVDGVVLERALRPGDVVGGATDPHFRIARAGLIELDAEVPEAAVARVAASRSATITLPSGETLAGHVRLVSPRVDPATKLGRVRVALPFHPALRVGGFARATLGGEPRSALTAPERAVQYTADGPVVLVLDRANRVRRVAVRTGARADGHVELTQGPPAGTRVVLGGAALLLPGDRVRALSATQLAER